MCVYIYIYINVKKERKKLNVRKNEEIARSRRFVSFQKSVDKWWNAMLNDESPLKKPNV